MEILEAIKNHPRVTVRSGHKVGKTTTAAIAALWFVTSFPRARVVVTAPTGRQIRSIFWKELQRLYSKNASRIGGEMHNLPQIGLQFRDGREIVGFSTTEPEKMAGISGPALLFIVDEASGVQEDIFEAIEGNRAGGARLVMFSNPTQTSGTFFDSFHAKRHWWHNIHVNSGEAASQGVPGLATQDWLDEKLGEWGPESPLYHVRVLGNFPSQSERAVIPLGLVEKAILRYDDTPDDEEAILEVGVDVARYGDDDSVIVCRRGKKAYAPIVIRGQDTLQVAMTVLDTVRGLRRQGEIPLVKVDAIGVGGGVVDILRIAREEVDVSEINVSERARKEDEFVNARAELWFNFRTWLEQGGTFPSDTKLESELVAPTYDFDHRGRRRIEGKDAIKQRIGRSPDRADALILACWSMYRIRVSPHIAHIAPSLNHFESSPIG